jgi:hypothetical protein
MKASATLANECLMYSARSRVTRLWTVVSQSAVGHSGKAPRCAWATLGLQTPHARTRLHANVRTSFTPENPVVLGLMRIGGNRGQQLQTPPRYPTYSRSRGTRGSVCCGSRWRPAPEVRLCSPASFCRWDAVSARAPPSILRGADCYSAAIAVAATSPAITLASRNVPIATSSILSQSASTLPLCCPNSGAGPTAGGASPKRTGQPLIV